MLILACTALNHPCHADDISWTAPWGTARTLSSGVTASYLRAGTASGGEVELLYGDGTTIPAVAESGSGSDHARASLGIEESNASGLYISGRVDSESNGSGPNNFAEVKLTLLLDPANHGTILLENLVAAATLSSSPGEYFTLQIFRATATGEISGPALFTLDGNTAGQAGIELPTDSAHYLIALTAHAEPGKATPLDFAFTVDFGAPAAVPEPASGLLLSLAGAALLARRRR